MKTLLLISIAAALATSSIARSNQNIAASSSLTPPEPRHVILIIGDGMDEQQITIARNYLKGARKKLLLDEMPVRAAAGILTITDNVDGKMVYVADSANTATSMATGEVTSRGRIATSAGSDRALPTIAELAKAAGYKTGIVSSASVTDATPAAFMAHINYRLCENPSQMAAVTYSDIVLGNCTRYMKSAGGPGSIAQQLANSQVDVILGGGRKHFEVDAEAEKLTTGELARRNGFSWVNSLQQLQQAPYTKRLLGTFSSSTLPVRLRGENNRLAETPTPSLLNRVHRYLGDVTLPSPMVCEPNPDFTNIPTLKQMTDTAIAHLAKDNDRGFFLMVESASIDKQSHERKPCGSIGEVQQLNEVLASALAFAKLRPRTLILVTADHAQAAQLIPDESLFSAYPIPTYTPGYVARIVTPQGSILAVNYATSNFIMEEHTGAAVPLYSNAEGVGLIPAFIHQPELFGIMKDYLEL